MTNTHRLLLAYRATVIALLCATTWYAHDAATSADDARAAAAEAEQACARR